MSNDRIIYDFLKTKGLNPYAIVGVMGNLFAESGLSSTNLENSYEGKLRMSDEQYTKAVDNGSYKNFINDKAGYGLAQWTYWSRKEALLNFAKNMGVSIGDINMQLEYLWKELNQTISIKALNATNSIREASDIILLEFERPADQSEAVRIKRAGYGQMYYDKFCGTETPVVQKETPVVFTPYLARVIIDALNIRSGPSINNDVVDCITDHGSYTIIEVSKDSADKLWGKLKSGAGWVRLDYTERV